jgi:hypothetical protein
MAMGLGPRWLRRGMSHIPNVPGSGLLAESAGWAVRSGTEAARTGTEAARQSTQVAWQSTQLAWQGARLVTTPVRQTASALAALPGITDELAGPKRRVWTYSNRVHVRLRGSYGPAAHRRR